MEEHKRIDLSNALAKDIPLKEQESPSDSNDVPRRARLDERKYHLYLRRWENEGRHAIVRILSSDDDKHLPSGIDIKLDKDDYRAITERQPYVEKDPVVQRLNLSERALLSVRAYSPEMLKGLMDSKKDPDATDHT